MDYANTTNVEFIVDPGFHAGPAHITKFQDMAKQINNFERMWRDRNKCEIFFSKTQLVKELLSFDFWISRHFVTIFGNMITFQGAISPKAIELFQKFFHICFYHATFFQNY